MLGVTIIADRLEVDVKEGRVKIDGVAITEFYRISVILLCDNGGVVDDLNIFRATSLSFQEESIIDAVRSKLKKYHSFKFVCATRESSRLQDQLGDQGKDTDPTTFTEAMPGIVMTLYKEKKASEPDCLDIVYSEGKKRQNKATIFLSSLGLIMQRNSAFKGSSFVFVDTISFSFTLATGD